MIRVLTIAMVVTSLFVFSVLSTEFGTHEALILVLNAVIFTEIFRTLWEFAFKDDNRIKMRYVIDAGFVFIFKEIYLAAVLLKEEFQKGVQLLAVYFIVLLLIVITRILLTKYSPSNME